MKSKMATATIMNKKRVKISRGIDISQAISEAIALAETAGFEKTDRYMVATAVSELARNIFVHAVKGEIAIRIIDRQAHRGIEIVAKDSGPGIENMAEALKDGHSTSGSLGLGLPGVKRLTDELTIESQPGRGTRVTARKWV